MTTIKEVVAAQSMREGAGVRINRALGSGALRSLDPFLMLDFFCSDEPSDYLAGFPDHPHRGFVTITYMLDGRMRHRDSMGNEGVLHPGGVQWMKAASGVIHSEMPEQQDGLMRGFQLWLNLPAKQKMTAPAYRDIDPAEIPLIDSAWGQMKLIAGDVRGIDGPVVDPFTDLFYADLAIEPGRQTALDGFDGRSLFVFVYEGEAEIAGTTIGAGRLAVVEAATLDVSAGQSGASLVVVAGKPLNEPVVHYGPFVMNNEHEIRAAVTDYQRGELVKKRAERV